MYLRTTRMEKYKSKMFLALVDPCTSVEEIAHSYLPFHQRGMRRMSNYNVLRPGIPSQLYREELQSLSSAPRARFLQRPPHAILTHHPPGATRAGLRFGPDQSAEEAVSQDPLWYKDTVFYELHVEAFHDSNGDGNGGILGSSRTVGAPRGHDFGTLIAIVCSGCWGAL